MPVRIFDQHLPHKPGFILRWAGNLRILIFDQLIKLVNVIDVQGQPSPLMPLAAFAKKMLKSPFTTPPKVGSSSQLQLSGKPNTSV